MLYTGLASMFPKPSHLSTAALSLFGQLSQQISALVITVIAAMILSIADYGLYALAVVFVELCVLFAYSGFFGFLIAAKSDDPALISTMFWTMLGIGCICGTLLMACAEPAARVFHTDDLAPLLQIFALLQPFGAITAWASARLIREGQIGRYYRLMWQSNFSSLFLGVTILLVWPSLYALVIYRIIRVALNLWLFTRASPLPSKLRFDGALFLEGFRFARGHYGARVAEYLSTFGADLLLAYFFSTTESGLYRIANRLAAAATDLFILPLKTFATKAFAEAARQGKSLEQGFADFLAAGLMLVGGMSVVVLTLGVTSVSLVFQPDFLAATFAMHVFVVRAFILWPHHLLEPLLAAQHRTELIFFHNAIWLGVSLCSVIIVAPFGLNTLALSQTVIAGCMSLTALFVLNRFGHVSLPLAARKASRSVLLIIAYGVGVTSGWSLLKAAPLTADMRLLSGLLLSCFLAILALFVATKAKTLNPKIFAGA